MTDPSRWDTADQAMPLEGMGRRGAHVTDLFGLMRRESEVVADVSEGLQRAAQGLSTLHAIQTARTELANLSAEQLREGLAQRHAALGGGVA